mgnify:CR=1 FL=1
MNIWTIIGIVSSLLGIISFIKNDSSVILLFKKASFEIVAESYKLHQNDTFKKITLREISKGYHCILEIKYNSTFR